MKDVFAKIARVVMRWIRVAMRWVRAVIPVAGDSRKEWVRKIAFLTALIVFIGSGFYLVYEVLIQPYYTQEITHSMRDLYTDGENAETESKDDPIQQIKVPEYIAPSFAALYRRNQDIAGWLKFVATDGSTADDLFGGAIDNLVVQSDDNKYYLNRDYLGELSRSGTLYFDYRNNLQKLDEERNVIIYGHNLNSGLMFSRFNKLVSGKVERARKLSTVTLDTAYGETAVYKVFAVMIIDVDAKGDAAFDYIRTQFTKDEQFETFIEKIRARSLYDFGDVDVTATDSVLTLSTCSNKRDTTLKNGRTVIVARRVRDGESTTVDSSKTVLNDDVLMPKAWYINKETELPAEYQ